MEFEFLVTNTPEGWNSWDSSNCKVEAGGAIITNDPAYIFKRTVLFLEDRVPGTPDFCDMALDECGILYFIEAEQGHIYRYDKDQDIFERIFCPVQTEGERESLRFTNPGGIRVTRDNIYIVDTGGKRLHCISKYLLQTRWVRNGDTFSNPADLVVDNEENIYVLDTAACTVVRVTGSGAVSEIIGSDYLKDPLVIDMDAGRRLYVLDKSGYEYRLWRFVPEDGSYTLKEPEKFLIKGIRPSCIAAGAEDEIFLGEATEAFKEKEKSKSLNRYVLAEGAIIPIPSYKGSIHRLVSDPKKNLYVMSGDRERVSFLEYSLQNRSGETGHPYKGYLTKRFDSGTDDTKWHRMKLDFDLSGPGTQVRVYYHATNDGDVHEEDIEWSAVFPPNPGDALFDVEVACGKYLWLKIELIGSMYDSPRVKSLRIYYPRMSYLRYLPALYQENESSRKFLEKFLSLFESFFMDNEEVIDGITRYLDPGGVPADYLSWLGSWLGVDAGETWTEENRRQLTARAPELYKMRGTRQGLLEMLGLYLNADRDDGSKTRDVWDEACSMEKKALDKLVDGCYLTLEERTAGWEAYEKFREERIEISGGILGILEYLQLDVITDSELKKIYSDLLGGPYCFIVIISRALLSDEQLRTAQRIVNSEKPAHTVGRVIDLKPWIYLGGHSYLGVNTILSKAEFVLERSGLGQNTVISEIEEYGQFDLKSRIGVDTRIS